MRKLFALSLIVLAFSAVHPSSANAGWLSGLLGKENKSAEPAPGGKASGSAPKQATTPQDAATTPTPDPERVEKLRKAIEWEKPPKDLLDRYVGTWQGDFWAYTVDGKLEQHNKVRMTFTKQGDGSLKMEMWSGDLLSKMWVTKLTATYTIQGDRIICTVQQPDGSTFKQIGHYNDNSVFFVSDTPKAVEHSRERIDGKRFLTDGFGVYERLSKNNAHVFIGRFLKQE